MTKTIRTRDLTRAVVRTFQHAGFSPADILQGQIVHTDLMWQAPALRTQATLLDLPMSAYLDYPVKADSEAFYNFYCETLAGLSQHPTRVLSLTTGWKGLGASMPYVDPGERMLRFTVPEGFPAHMDEFAGHRFALECAHFAHISLPVTGYTENETSYWVETEFGNYGVVDGLPTVYSDLWDLSCENQVDSFLHEARGQGSNTCHYDVLARVRSALYESMDKFAEFEALDQAIQTLRILTNGRLCSELLQGIEGMPKAAFFARKKIETINECIETMERWNLNDRTKISMLFERLVPDVLTMRQYQVKIMDPYRLLPAVLSLKSEQRIINVLKSMKERLINANEI